MMEQMTKIEIMAQENRDIPPPVKWFPQLPILFLPIVPLTIFFVVLSCVQKMRDNNNASEMIVHLTRIGGMAK